LIDQVKKNKQGQKANGDKTNRPNDFSMN